VDWFRTNLRSNSYGYIDYVKPGRDLTREIFLATKNAPLKILILENHGLILSADSIDEIVGLLDFVSSTTKIDNQIATSFSPSNSEKLNSGASGFRKLSFDASNILCGHDMLIHRLCEGVLFPDFVVFAGRAPEICNSLARSLKPDSKCKIVVGDGIFVPLEEPKELDEIVWAACELIYRSRDSEKLRYLSQEDENDLLNWSEEKYRQSILRGFK
jgi:rhamnose utilization protein RhaD (predicted bifunctional aldolase and dehydrogenase)